MILRSLNSITFALFHLSAFSGDSESKIEYIRVSSAHNSANAKFQKSPDNSPPCATDGRMAVELDTDSGRAVYSLLLSDQASGREVFGKGMSGGDACIAVPSMDTIRYIRQL